MKFTILGASGFIGSHLVEHLRGIGAECFTPGREDPSIYENKLGHIVYCVGLTADFRQWPHETVRAHVCHLLNILEQTKFKSFLYLSSTRVYRKSVSGQEDAEIGVNPTDPSDLYNLSKLMGESICFASRNPNVRVARLSNVYGTDFSSKNFLFSMIRNAVEKNRITLETTLESEKDYVSVTDVARLLHQISLSGRHRIYNVASGMNVSNDMLLDKVRQVTGCEVKVSERTEGVSFPLISIKRIQDEYGFHPTELIPKIDGLIMRYRNRIEQETFGGAS